MKIYISRISDSKQTSNSQIATKEGKIVFVRMSIMHR